MATEQVVQPVPRRRTRMRSMLQDERVIAYIFVAPALFLIVAIAFWPIIQSIWYSLLNYIPTYPQFGSKFVGLQNYVKVFQDSTFTGSIGYTVLFTVVSVALEFLLGLLFALVLNQRFPGRGIARAAVLVPWAFPTVISAVVWRALMWQNNTGAIPAILHTFGLVPATWAPLASNGTLMAAMIIIDVWKTAPFMALLLLAGLQVISEEVYEAGRVDGANVWQRFFRITLPLLKPAILVALLFRTLDAWRVFDMFFVVAGNRLASMSVYAYNEVVTSAINFPLGVAASTLIFIGAIIIATIFIKGFGTQTAA
jgi:trehalose/maltose transport system permease protein